MCTEETTPNDVDCLELARLLRRTSRMMARAHHRCEQGSHRDLGRHAQEHILSLLRQHGGINQAALQEMLDVRSASLSELLAKLEKAGRIVRERNPEDRRGFIISLARTGEEEDPVQDGAPDNAAQARADRLFAPLTLEERRHLWQLLQKLTAPLEDPQEEALRPCGHRRGPGDRQACRREGLGGRGGRGGRRRDVAD